MPGNIREYNSPVNGLQPSSNGPAAYARIGQANQAAADAWGKTIENVSQEASGLIQTRDNHIYQQELVQGASAYATMQMNWNQKWQDYLKNSDPNDPTTQTRFWSEVVQPDIDNFNNSFKTDRGKLWAADRTASAQETWFKSTTADVSNLAAVTTGNNIDNYASGRISLLADNPDQLDSTLKEFDDTIPGLVTNSATDPVTGAKIAANAVQQAKYGAVITALDARIAKDPTTVLKEYADGTIAAKYGEILGKNITSIRDAAEAEVQHQNDKAAAASTATRTLQTQQAKGAESSIYKATFGADGTQIITPDYFDKVKQYAQMPGADPATAKAMYDYGIAIRDKKTAKVDDDAVVRDFQSRVDKGLTASEVQRAVVDQKLTQATADGMLKYLGIAHPADGKKSPFTDDPVAEQMYTRAKNLFALNKDPLSGLFMDPSTGRPMQGNDLAKAQQADQDYQSWFLSSFENGIRSGLTARQMSDPSDPAYLPRKYPGPDPDKIISPPKYAPLTFTPGVPNPAGASAPSPTTAPATPGSPTPAPAPSSRPSLDDIGQKTGLGPLFQAPPGAKPAATKPQASNAPAGGTVQPVNFVTPGAGHVVDQVNAATGGHVPLVTPGGRSIDDLAANGDTTPVKLAEDFIGTNEVNHQQILSAFIKKAAGIDINPRTTAWCAAWANAVLAASGYAQGRGNGARGTVGNGEWAFDFENYGTDARAAPSQGDVVVFRWSGGGGHVGFYMGEQVINGRKYIQVLGGNQGGAAMNGGGVSISLEPADQASAIRHPVKYQPSVSA